MIGTILTGCWCLTGVWFCLPPDAMPQARPQRSEMPRYVQEMRYLDANGDRKIDTRELAAGQQIASVLLMLSWEDCDQDDDGGLSLEELQKAADAALQELLTADSESESEEQAQEELAKAISLQVLLKRLGNDDRYAEEIEELREAVEDLDDDEAVVAYINRYPARYPRLSPVLRTWVRHYPVKPGLRRHVKPLPPRTYKKSATKVKPATTVKPAPNTAKPAAKKPVKKPTRTPKKKPGRP